MLNRAYWMLWPLRQQQMQSLQLHLLAPCGDLQCSQCLRPYLNWSTARKGRRWSPTVRRLFQSGRWNLATSSCIPTLRRRVGRCQNCSCFLNNRLSLDFLCLSSLCVQHVRMSDLWILWIVINGLCHTCFSFWQTQVTCLHYAEALCGTNIALHTYIRSFIFVYIRSLCYNLQGNVLLHLLHMYNEK